MSTANNGNQVLTMVCQKLLQSIDSPLARYSRVSSRDLELEGVAAYENNT